MVQKLSIGTQKKKIFDEQKNLKNILKEEHKMKKELRDQYGRRGRGYRKECKEMKKREDLKRKEAKQKMENKISHLQKKHGDALKERNILCKVCFFQEKSLKIDKYLPMGFMFFGAVCTQVVQHSVLHATI